MRRFTLSALAVACANASLSHAQAEPVSPAGPVEHVLVTMPLHKETAETALPFTVISGEELRRAASATIGDTLADTPGMNNASFGPGVGQPVIRGQQGPRVRVLQNGTSSADAARASQDHANSVEALLADSIEVLRGPSTLLYGGGAIGGVINVLDNRIPTQRRDELGGGVAYRHDTASSMDVLVGRLDGGAGDFAFHLDAMVRDFDDLEIPGDPRLFPEEEHDHDEEEHAGEVHEEHEDEVIPGRLSNTAGEASSFTVGGSYHFDAGFFGLAVNRLENQYGIPSGAHDHGHDEEEHDEEHEDDHADEHDEEMHDEHEHGDITLDIEQTRYDAALHYHDLFPGIEVARAFVTYTDYEHAEIEGSGEVGTVYGNETWEGRLEVVHKNIAGFDGVFGLQLVSGEFSAIGEEAFIPVTDSREIGLFVVEDYHAGDWTYEFGLRVDRDEREAEGVPGTTDFTSLSGSAAALWQVSENWQLGLAFSRAERAPSLEELYSNVGNDLDSLVLHAATDAYEVGSVDLDTEISRNADLSLRWQQGSSNASLQVYYNDFADFINLTNSGESLGESPILFFDQEDATFYGVEFDSEFNLMSIGAGELFLGLFGDMTRGELDGGADVPRLPPLRIGAELSWESARWNLWSRVLDAAEQDNPGLNETETPGFTRWDAGVEYFTTFGDSELSLFVSARNISDEDIRLSTSFLRNIAPEAGRAIEAGVSLRF